jgi:hypothetical protein
VFAGGSAGAGADEWLALFDPGPAPAHVQLTASGLGRAQPLPAVTVAAGSRQLVHIGAEYPKGIVVLAVAADAPIVAERGQFLTTGPGMSDSIGIVGASGEGRNG